MPKVIINSICKIQNEIQNLEYLINVYLKTYYNSESIYRKEAFRNSILSIFSGNADIYSLSAKESLASTSMRNLDDIQTALELASEICFGDSTMEEANIWNENFKDNYSEDDPQDIQNYIELLK